MYIYAVRAPYDISTEDTFHDPIMNTSIHLAKRPKENIIPGETFEIRKNPIPEKEDVKDGEVLIKVEYLSVDPGIFHFDVY
jgi:NADPH-dependent curcumin reductase CurA